MYTGIKSTKKSQLYDYIYMYVLINIKHFLMIKISAMSSSWMWKKIK